MILLSATFSPAFAKDPATADEALSAAQDAYGPQPPKKRCPTAEPGDEIVVCAEEQEQSQFRIRSDEQVEDDYARETMDKGAPRAPDVAGPGIFTGPATVGSLCLPGLQKCPSPPAYIVDFSQLPEAPPGSDADRVGRGLAPTGNEKGTASPSPPVSPPGSASPAEEPSDSASPPEARAPG